MTSMLHPRLTARRRSDDLSEAERLLLWAFRTWVRGVAEETPCCWSAVWNLFAVRFGTADGKQAVAALSAMVRRLNDHARQPFVYHQPACGCVGEDEAVLLGICTTGNVLATAGAERQARRLVEPAAAVEFAGHAARLTRLFERHGLPLAGRAVQASAQAEAAALLSRPAAATLH